MPYKKHSTNHCLQNSGSAYLNRFFLLRTRPTESEQKKLFDLCLKRFMATCIGYLNKKKIKNGRE